LSSHCLLTLLLMLCHRLFHLLVTRLLEQIRSLLTVLLVLEEI